MPRPLAPLAGCVLAVFATVGCEDDETVAAPGVLTARWGGTLCAEDGVARVSFSLGGGALEEPIASSAVCGDQEYRFSRLQAGAYELTVQFLAPGDGGALPVADAEGAIVDRLVFAARVDAGLERTVFVGADIVGDDRPDAGIDPDGGVPPDGVPTPIDDDLDGVFDEHDNCLGLFNPDQLDTDQDKAGNACDCAPTDGALEITVLDDELDANMAQFTALDGTWDFFGGIYRQSDSNGLARSWRPADDLGVGSVDTRVSLGASGGGAVGGTPFVGVALRAAGFATGPDAGQAYVCGSDGDALFIGILDAGGGTFTPLASQVLPFAVVGAAPLHASAEDDALVCRLTNPADAGSWLEITAVDSTFVSGATGFVTNGMAADYGFARICTEE